MIYYKVRAMYDKETVSGKTIYKGQLFTEREMKNYGFKENMFMFFKVDIPSVDTYYTWGNKRYGKTSQVE
jgi:hypothetical protein